MKLIVKMQFGSHVYGTNVPESDTDYKAIYIPDGKDIVLQRVKKNITQHTKKDQTKKNSADDVDMEIFSLQEYIKLLLEGQTGAIDMLFTPAHFWIPVLPNGVPEKGIDHNILSLTTWWMDIQQNRQKLLHKGTSSYVGYCQTQAAKYGLKGSRMADLKVAMEFLKSIPQDDKLDKHWDMIINISQDAGHMGIDVIEGPNQQMLEHWVVCNRKMGKTVTAGYALASFQKVYDAYGERAKLAEKNEGVDWKALMHAVRVCKEAEELLLTGHITFPRPEAPLLLQIRKAELPYKQVAEIIEKGLLDVEDAKAKSTLPEEPDYAFAEELIYQVYKRAVDITEE